MYGVKMSYQTSFLSVISVLSIVSCCSCHLVPRDDSDFTELQKQRADSPSNSFRKVRNSTSRSESSVTPTTSIPAKEWHIGRVTRKQYEIINMLWRKTEIFVNVENTTPDPKQDNITKKIFDSIIKQNPIIFSSRPPISQSSTDSYIEFYYLDETEQAVDQYCANRKLCKPYKNNNQRNSSFVIFHIKGQSLINTTASYHPFGLIHPYNSIGLSSQSPLMFTHRRLPKNILTGLHRTAPKTTPFIISSEIKTNKVGPRMSPYTKKPFKPKLTFTSFKNNYNFTEKNNYNLTESTTVYDKIKFFELYDKHTRVPFAMKPNMFEFNNEQIERIEDNQVHKILLEHVDQSSHGHNEAKHSKKHIVENDKNQREPFSTDERNANLNSDLNETTGMDGTNTSILQDKLLGNKMLNYCKNESVSWSEYPFTAVFVYEPSHVHCDAAGISAHWLVASGSCLSRLNQRDLLGEGRSAFVAYCGESWWEPERITYVKYSGVHPRYHPRDPTRKHLYNIGVIQVVTSMMSACSGWAPVCLMSHQFTASHGGTEATALGWGLDRYDNRYAASDLPKSSLMLYKGLVFSDSCPGNNGYSKVKRVADGVGVKNVYCLSLPPYSGEEKDPVHGSLLLVEGKLIALYLQEERRQTGDQSAQYTGIWQLIPWVMEVAREPEEMEALTDEI